MNLNKLDSFRINYNYVNKKYFIIKIINLKRNLFYVEFSNVLDILSIMYWDIFKLFVYIF